MATIMSLSEEVFIMILEKISIEDIENFRSTCKKFQQIVTLCGNSFWKKKLYERWPSTKKVHDQMEVEEICQLDFAKQVKETVICLRELWQFISQLTEHTLDDNEDMLIDFANRIAHSTYCYIFMDEMKRIIKEFPWTFGCDLTRRYYCYHIFLQLKDYRIINKFLNFIHGPRGQELLERLVTYMVQCFKHPLDTYVSYSYIEETLDNIAQKVWETLKEEYPMHGIFEMTEELIYWKNNNISRSYWNRNDVWQILTAIKKIVFSQSYFHQLKQLWIQQYNASLRQNNFLIIVSQDCESMFLLIIYHSILRRFGIHSTVMGDSPFIKDKLYIFVKPKEDVETSIKEYFCFEQRNGQFSCENTTRERDFGLLESDYVEDALYSLTRSLYKELRPSSKALLIMQEILERTSTAQDAKELIKLVHSSGIMVILGKNELERRSAKIKYAVGMIVKHKYKNDSKNHIGVIAGWHLYCNTDLIEDDLFSTLPDNFSNIKCKEKFEICTDSMCSMHKQPCYIILCEHNEYCYVPQEKIESIESKWIKHKEIGRYFSRYIKKTSKNTYYVANETLAKDYPDDAAIINEMEMHNQLL